MNIVIDSKAKEYIKKKSKDNAITIDLLKLVIVEYH